MAERSAHSDGRGRLACRDWRAGESGSIRLFLAAGVYVLPELVPGRVISSHRASPFRRGLVRADSAFLRAHLHDAISVDGFAVYSDRAAGKENLSLDA